MQSFAFTPGDVLDHPGITAGFNVPDLHMINFFSKNGQLFMTSFMALEETTMASQETITLAAGDTIPVKPMFLYGFGDYRFLIRNFYPNRNWWHRQGLVLRYESRWILVG